MGRLAGETFIGLGARAGFARCMAAVETESISTGDEGIFPGSLDIALESESV